MQHSAYASADKSLKVLPRSGSPLQEIHREPGHQFCPIWLLTNPWQLHVAVLASAFEIFSMTCTFVLVLSQKNRYILYVHTGSFMWSYTSMSNKKTVRETQSERLSRTTDCLTFQVSSMHLLQSHLLLNCCSGPTEHTFKNLRSSFISHALRGCIVNQTDEQLIEKYSTRAVQCSSEAVRQAGRQISHLISW